MGQTSSKSKFFVFGGIFVASSYFWLKPVWRKLSLSMLISAEDVIKKTRRPKRIILIRHGESEAHLDTSVFVHTPDNQISLTGNGIKQSEEAAITLKKIIGTESVKFFVSPYKRGKQTSDILMKHFKDNVTDEVIDPRLREQEWGNFKNKDPSVVAAAFAERKKVGKFFYRFLYGESGADVYDRVSLFLESIFRDMRYFNKASFENYVIVCHGLTMRLFTIRFLHLPTSSYETMVPPGNCEYWMFETDENGSYKMTVKYKENDTNISD